MDNYNNKTKEKKFQDGLIDGKGFYPNLLEKEMEYRVRAKNMKGLAISQVIKMVTVPDAMIKSWRPMVKLIIGIIGIIIGAMYKKKV